jgi:hypothetical protein
VGSKEAAWSVAAFEGEKLCRSFARVAGVLQ